MIGEADVVVPEALARNVRQVWQADGRRWLAELPRTLAGVAADWELTLGRPYDLSYHYVTAVTCADGRPAVLKLGVPSGDSLRNEAPALAAFAGRGAVRLLRADLDRGALLLERAEPGGRLRDLVPTRDTEATSVAAELLRRLAVPPPADCPLPDLSTYAAGFDRYLAAHGDGGPLPADLVGRAGGLMRELCASAPRRAVLHGDLHHDNILRAEREPWLAIDPHGLVGDPGFEIGALLYNPAPENRDPALTALVPARVEQLADLLAIPADRVVGWGFVMAVLSDVWTAEDWTPGAPSPASRALDVAHLLLPRLS
ncbi:aminoglycoside phosphotransferase family protein [Micromonospora sp. WMMD1102]|uniref:aminoglycoside phosphotransferase family protein n=1 Tax=Micromonospora sp. WMMD1102 TaxID=3016105 RepID=UPI002414D348|nr:aminoglycoside phosphotransferase family protein [Micromonospora sp. WMMD1102]MDG4784572.1 aminoglycoside phosphotransferase family protein [Micromonospora sp. WMMD1102]